MVLALTDGTVRAVQVICGIGVEPDTCQSGPPMVVPQAIALIVGQERASTTSTAIA